MMIIFFWIILSVLVGVFAKSAMNRGFGGAFFISLILSPLVGFVIVLIDGAKGKKCPSCAELVKVEAIKCKHCQHDFNQTKAG